MGQQGVTKALEIIQKEMDVTMALCGRRDIEQVNLDNLIPKSELTANDYM
jgi:L-lactate dehydrogenase (cytochrome)